MFFWFLLGCYLGGMATLIAISFTRNEAGEVLEPYTTSFFAAYLIGGLKGVAIRIVFFLLSPIYLAFAAIVCAYENHQDRKDIDRYRARRSAQQ